jgi:hypothetical protein
MAKLISKSELIQKITDQHSNGLSRKDIKAKPARKVIRARPVKAVKDAVA